MRFSQMYQCFFGEKRFWGRSERVIHGIWAQKNTRAPKRASAGYVFSLAVAANAEYDDQRKNDDPGAVIVEEMTKAVVHNDVLPFERRMVLALALPPYVNILCTALRGG